MPRYVTHIAASVVLASKLGEHGNKWEWFEFNFEILEYQNAVFTVDSKVLEFQENFSRRCFQTFYCHEMSKILVGEPCEVCFDHIQTQSI